MAKFHRRSIRALAFAALALLLLLGAMVLAGPPEGDRATGGSTRVAGAAAEGPTATDAPPGSSGTTATAVSSAPGAASEPNAPAGDAEDDDGEFPGLPEDDEDPGPWVPPTSVDDLAPTPLVLDLVAATATDPGPAPNGQDQDVDGFSTGSIQCDGRCIARATVQPGGTDATFRVHTTVPARIWVVLDSPAVQDSSARVRDYEVTFDGLEADTTYNVTLVAEDQHGNLDHRYGQLTTLRRQVTIEFTSIHVIDDADKGGKGEIEWFFAVDGSWIEAFHRGIGKIKGGSSIHLEDRRFTIDGADDDVELTVQGVEHDHQSFCSAGTGPFDDGVHGGDLDGCHDLATAGPVRFDLDDLEVLPVPPVPGAGSHDAVFMLRTRAYYLEFDAYGTIDVRYI